MSSDKLSFSPNGPSWASFTRDNLPSVSMSSTNEDIYGEERSYSVSFRHITGLAKTKYSSTAQRNAAKPGRMRQPCLIALVVSFQCRPTLKSTLRGKRCQTEISTLHPSIKNPRRCKSLPGAKWISRFRPLKFGRFCLQHEGRLQQPATQLHHPTYIATHTLRTH